MSKGEKDMKLLSKTSIKIFILISALLALSALLFFPEHITKFFKILRSILLPFILGLGFAFLIDKPVTWLQSIFKFKKKSFSRVFCTILFILVLAGIIALLTVPMANSLSKSLSLLFEKLPEYLNTVFSAVNKFFAKLGISFNLSSESLIGSSGGVESSAVQITRDITDFIIDKVTILSIAVIAAIYFVIYKDALIKQADKFCFAMFENKTYFLLVRVGMETNKVFSGYFSGKLLQCLLVAVATFIAMWAIGLPYALLISLIMGIFNIISMIGPIISAIPCAILLLLDSPMSALWFIVITIAVQFILGQVIGPKMLGDSTGLSSFWVLFALVAGAAIGGILGMIIGIPLFAVIYIFIKESVNLRILKKEGKRFESKFEKVYNRWRKEENGVE